MPRSVLGSFGVSAVAVAAVGCASLRQNLRGQELSYRGAYACVEAGCAESKMQRSTAGTRRGDLLVTAVKLQPRAAAMFTAQAAFDRLEVIVRDCKGREVALAERSIKRPGDHQIGPSEARESWAVIVDPGELGELERGKSGECATWILDAKATWSDGATYSLAVGLEVGR